MEHDESGPAAQISPAEARELVEETWTQHAEQGILAGEGGRQGESPESGNEEGEGGLMEGAHTCCRWE